MSFHRCLTVALALAALAALAPAAHSGNIRMPAPARPIGDEKPTQVHLGPVFQGGTCNAGGPPQALESLQFIQNGDAYFTLIDPSSCVDCTETHTLTVDQIHIGLRFNTACSLPVEISIVEAEDDLGCYLPEDDVFLMSPIALGLNGNQPGVFEYTIPLQNPVCLRGPAFLMVRVTSIDPACVAEDARPELTFGDENNCPLCHYFFLTDGGGSGDLCDPTDTPQRVPLQQWVSGSCCSLMPVAQKSWGELKVRYKD
jgi:hypothetical protein